MKTALTLPSHVRLESKNTPEVICLAYYDQYFLRAFTYQAAPRWNPAWLGKAVQHKGLVAGRGSDVRGNMVHIWHQKGQHDVQVRSVRAIHVDKSERAIML